MISETKIDNSFPKKQFHYEGYCVDRLDRTEYGGGILVYVREDIPSEEIPMQNSMFIYRIKVKKQKMAFVL